MPLRLLAGLLLCNAIWAASPVLGKLLLESFSPLQVAWLRSASAMAALPPLLLLLRRLAPGSLSPRGDLGNPRTLLWLVATGLGAFFATPAVQYLGLARTTAISGVVIVAMEPLLAAGLAALLLREQVRAIQGLAFLVSVTGFCLLSNLDPGALAASLALFNVGNLLVLASMAGDGMYSVGSRRLAGSVRPASILAVSLSFGFLALTTLLAVGGAPFPSLAALSGRDWLTLLALGPLGTTLTYVFWSFALRHASVTTVSLTLFLQPLLGAAAGWLVLGERLSPWQAIGAGLILAALCAQAKVAVERQHERIP